MAIITRNTFTPLIIPISESPMHNVLYKIMPFQYYPIPHTLSAPGSLRMSDPPFRNEGSYKSVEPETSTTACRVLMHDLIPHVWMVILFSHTTMNEILLQRGARAARLNESSSRDLCYLGVWLNATISMSWVISEHDLSFSKLSRFWWLVLIKHGIRVNNNVVTSLHSY